MTTNFWKWLSRANARTALLTAVVAFIAAAAYWVWRELDQADPQASFNGALAAEAPAVTDHVQLLAFIKGQQENLEKAANNPFYRRPVWRPDPGQGNPGNPGNDPFVPQVKPAVKPTPAVKPPPPPPPPPPPKQIAVLYRGIMTRPDGTKTALIENQDTDRQKFFGPGDLFLKATVEGFDSDTVRLRRPDGQIITLARGQVSQIRED
jgi:hypothetical protein